MNECVKDFKAIRHRRSRGGGGSTHTLDVEMEPRLRLRIDSKIRGWKKGNR